MSTGAPPPAIETTLRLGFDVDPALTLSELQHGPADPTMRFEGAVVWRTARYGEDVSTVRMAPGTGGWQVAAWGPGAEAALAALPRLLGSEDDPSALQVDRPRLRALVARLHGLRLGRSDAVWASLLPAICSQKVTGTEAQRAYHGIVRRYGDRAPGPRRLWVTPRAEVIAALPYFELHPMGLEQRRAVTLIRAAERAASLEAAARLTPASVMARLQRLPGVGAWTAAETVRTALGDPDAVSLGDYHTPHLVCWALAGEARCDEARMLELLEPYRGQRARLIRVLECSGLRPPRYGPRFRGGDIREL